MKWFLSTDSRSIEKELENAISRHSNFLDEELDPAEIDPDRLVLSSRRRASDQLAGLHEFLQENFPGSQITLVDAATSLLKRSLSNDPPEFTIPVVLIDFLRQVNQFRAVTAMPTLLRRFRSALNAESEDASDSYFEMLEIAETALLSQLSISEADKDQYDSLYNALAGEWDYINGLGDPRAASFARTLCALEPQNWPVYLTSIVEANWHAEAAEPLDAGAFKTSVRNVVTEVDTGAVASQLWRLAPLFNRNVLRAGEVLDALMGDEDDFAPYTLEQDVSKTNPTLDTFTIRRRDDSTSRSFPLTTGGLDEHAAAKLIARLLCVAYVGALVQLAG